ncbi:MAG: preprotein translocase subunit SecG [Bacteroidales bacterium]|nr:preprotein translocase subunit SecG [Bacteroidales bacterium]
MYQFIVILILIVCVLLAIVVLVQNSKGGGLAANFAGGNQFMGAPRTADFLEKATWWLATILIVLSLAATVSIPRHTVENEVDTNISNVEMPVANQPAAAPAPAAQPAPEQE